MTLVVVVIIRIFVIRGGQNEAGLARAGIAAMSTTDRQR
jgi:hypothetical protein